MLLRFNKDKWGNTLIINTNNITTISMRENGHDNQPEIQISFAAEHWSTVRGADNIRIFNEWLAAQSVEEVQALAA